MPLQLSRGTLLVLDKKNRHIRVCSFWWERVDSNHRSKTQQIYSLPPLAAREHSHIQFFLFALIAECLFIIATISRKCKPFFEIF